jgi:hypothetical protein
MFVFARSLILHGLPRVLVSDRDPKVVLGLSQTLWRRLGTRLNMSSNRHLETDGQTESIASIARFSSFCDVFAATMDRTRQKCCLKWSLRTPLLQHSELSTPPSRRICFSPEEPPYLLCSTRPSIPISQDATQRLNLLHEVHALVHTVLAAQR